MKTNKFRGLIFTVLIALLGVNAYAVNPVVLFSGVNKLSINLNKVDERVQLNFKDVNGISLYSENIKNANQKYLKTFDISKLPDGLYNIEIEGDVKVSTYSINVINNKILSGAVEKSEIFKPLAVQRGEKVYVSKYNPQNTDLKVIIYDGNEHEIYSGTFDGKEKLGKIFDFSKLRGYYNIVMICDNKIYNQEVSIP